MHWRENHDVPPEQLIDVLSRSLAATMIAASALDPTIALPSYLSEAEPPPVGPPGA